MPKKTEYVDFKVCRTCKFFGNRNGENGTCLNSEARSSLHKHRVHVNSTCLLWTERFNGSRIR